MLKVTKVGVLLLGLLVWTGCGDDEPEVTPSTEEKTKNKPAITGSRIGWDYSTFKKVSAPGARYNGYARVIQLQDKSLMCVYEADGRVLIVRSSDLGATWSGPITVAAKPASFNNAVPDILQLNDGSILVCYNPRPHDIDPSRRFGIKTKKSYDGGLTWRDERLLYQAGYQFENGCWEPSAIQLPDGEIQLYFANEGPYTSSSEQNISMLRSFDNGLTWTSQPEIVSFRPGRRDGMPSPLLLQNGKDIVVAIEDNGVGEFKPYTVRTTVSDSWSTPVGANSPNRNYSLIESLNSSIYAGAPYLRQLKTGETVMSYQGTEGRTNNISSADMKVVIGNSEAKNFDRKSVPFSIRANSSGLWNSINVLDDNTVIALTSTNGFNSRGDTEVWMIKGHLIPEVAADRKAINVDGNQDEDVWAAPFPVFVGHRSVTQVTSQFTYDDEFLYVLHHVKDAKVTSGSGNPEDNDGVIVQLDAANKSYEKPGQGVYTFFLSADNILVTKAADNGKWVAAENDGKMKTASKTVTGGYVQEMAIPWSALGGKPAAGNRIGVNIRLSENTGTTVQSYKESISTQSPDQPFTWLTLTLK